MKLSRQYSIDAEFFQFLVIDESSEDDFGELWTKDAVDRMLAVGVNGASLGTLRNVDVPVELRVVDGDPSVDVAGYDHAVEGSIELPTGRLVVSGIADFRSAPRVGLEVGTYRLLLLVDGVESITSESEPADDKYLVYLWPGESRPPKLLKHWRGSGA